MSARRTRRLGSPRRALTALLAAVFAVLGVAATASAQRDTLPTTKLPHPIATMLVSSHGGVIPNRTKRSSADRCGKAGLVCTSVAVPLDRTGAVPGTITLHVEQLPAAGVARGTIFLIAGGPGQGSAHTFGLGDPAEQQLFRYLFPGYNLVAYDDRGTGESGLIDCPALQAATTADTERTAAAACGASLGAAANFYSTATHAEDLEAVRQSLGVDKVALYGVSYGTKLSMAYALAHPDHVSRLLLDSVLPPEGPDPYGASVLQQMPKTLPSYCAVGCNAKTFAADVVALANTYAAKPLQGKVLMPGGRTVKKQLQGVDFLSMVLDADLSPGEAAELPAVLHAARLGNTQPLLRLAVLHDAANKESAIDLSSGLYAATSCRDGGFPWDPALPVSDRAAALQAAVAALPAGTLGPFGPWAARFGNADFCLGWPAPTGGSPLAAGPLPDVPMLAVSGGIDLRTPTAGAQSVVSRFPQGHLLVVPGVGHSTVTADPSGCAINAVRSWMLDQAVPASCPATKPLVIPVSSLPSPGSAHPARLLSAGATYAIAKQTVQDAKALWLMSTSGGANTVPGVFGGKLVASGSSFRLVNFSDARGVAVSGKVTVKGFGPPLVFQGAVTVGGNAAAGGILGLVGSSLRGSLGGRNVG